MSSSWFYKLLDNYCASENSTIYLTVPLKIKILSSPETVSYMLKTVQRTIWSNPNFFNTEHSVLRLYIHIEVSNLQLFNFSPWSCFVHKSYSFIYYWFTYYSLQEIFTEPVTLGHNSSPYPEVTSSKRYYTVYNSSILTDIVFGSSL